LLENESAYRCFCSPQSAAGAQIAYVTSGCYQNCSDVSQEESSRRAQGGAQPFTVRLRVPADAHKRVYPDLVYGKIQRLKRSPAAPQSEDGDAESGVRIPFC
jgi:glutamyl-tRNA synthetase